MRECRKSLDEVPNKADKVWNRIFGFKVGDLVRFKYGKVSWEIYHIEKEGTCTRYWLRRRVRTKLKPKLIAGGLVFLMRPGVVYKDVYDCSLEFKSMRKVGEIS